MVEDSPMCRASNHFHDPTRSWDVSGLTTMGSTVTFVCGDDPFDILGGASYPPDAIKSNIFWATGYLEPASQPDAHKADNGNEQDWEHARDFYYVYLTGKTFLGNMIAETQSEKETYFTMALGALGQVLHLNQDMSVPAHTRDDFQRVLLNGHTEAHNPSNEGLAVGFFGEDLEVYVATFAGKHASWFDVPSPLPGLEDFCLTDFWDKNVYLGYNPEDTWLDNIGLAEFTNANFITEGSAGKYANPSLTSIPWDIVESYLAEDGVPDKRIYLAQNGALGHRLAAPGYFTSDLETYAVGQLDAKNKSLIIDEVVENDYARILIPKAITYSAKLIDYFFHGKLEISQPEENVYGIIDGSNQPQQFQYLKVNIRNITENEDMTNGSLIAVARYKKRLHYQPDLSADPPTAENIESEYTYSVSEPIANINLTYAANGTATPFFFDFSHNPIPVGITDLYLQVVFKGTLGKEADTAIAVGMKDLNEPTQIVLWNSSDYFYLNGNLLTPQEIRDNPEYFSLVDFNNNHVLDADEPNIDAESINTNLAIYPVGGPYPAYFSATYQNLAPGRFGRIIILTDMPEFNIYVSTETSNPANDVNLDRVIAGVTNQNNCFTMVNSFRNVFQHTWYSWAKYHSYSTGISTAPWPNSSACAPDICSPVAATTIHPNIGPIE